MKKKTLFRIKVKIDGRTGWTTNIRKDVRKSFKFIGEVMADDCDVFDDIATDNEYMAEHFTNIFDALHSISFHRAFHPFVTEEMLLDIEEIEMPDWIIVRNKYIDQVVREAFSSRKLKWEIRYKVLFGGLDARNEEAHTWVTRKESDTWPETIAYKIDPNSVSVKTSKGHAYIDLIKINREIALLNLGI